MANTKNNSGTTVPDQGAKTSQVIASHETALEIFKPVRAFNKELVPMIPSNVTCNQTKLLQNIENENLSDFVSPIYNLLVLDSSQRAKRSKTKSHILKLPVFNSSNIESLYKKDVPIFFYGLNEELGLVSPELLFLQLVQNKGPVYAIENALEMCGTYCTSAKSDAVAYDLENITSAEEINKFLNFMSSKTEYVKSIRIAKKFSKYLANGSASPQETKLYMKLALPRSVGGRGFSNLLFNYPVLSPAGAKNQTNKQFFYCDLANPVMKVSIEYDSNQFHSARGEVLADRKKKETLQGMGWKVFTFTADEVKDIEMFNEKASQIAKALHKYPGNFTSDFLRKQEELFGMLDRGKAGYYFG